MKLGEALVKRSDAVKRLESLRERARNSARFQEGEEPDEKIEKILEDAVHTITELETLTRAINLTNASYTTDDGVTLMNLLARRDALKNTHSLYHNVAEAASGGRLAGLSLRHTRTELPWVTAMPVPELRKLASKAAQDFRELDVKIQQLNWEIDLIQ